MGFIDIEFVRQQYARLNEPLLKPLMDKGEETQQDIGVQEQFECELVEFTGHLCLYEKTRRDINSFISDLNKVDWEKAFQKFVRSWIRKRLDAGFADYNNETHLEASIDRLPGRYSNYRFPDEYDPGAPSTRLLFHKERHQLAPEELMIYTLKAFDPEALEQAIEKAKTTIKQEAYQQAAESLVDFFKISWYYGREDKIKLQNQKGRIILCGELWGREDRRGEQLDALLAKIGTYAVESGSTGLLSCMEEARSIQGYEAVPSRTPVNLGNDVHAVFYKEKLKFHLDEDEFASLWGFITTYYDGRLRELEIK
ncbi:hypothetical protein ACQU0X_25985 [Pseudovibrio ascidiaceicola]|uniref:hypothetical protein n=1 Tax=Pseudovibrio ascidiaceicola TaxID=285279 RepID=UPI003D36ACFE